MKRMIIMSGVGLVLMMGGWLVPAGLGYESLDPRPLEKNTQNAMLEQGAAKYLKRQTEAQYPLAAKLNAQGWFMVDLKPYCNLNVFSAAGKTCPVQFHCMNTGRQTFYGVPFEIIAPSNNENRTVVALPSIRLFPNDNLPASVEAPIGRKTAVLYFLYTTYWTTPEGNQFFRFNYADGTTLPFKFVGTVHSGDWYHQDTRIYTEDVHYVLVPSTPGSKLHHRNMHILQWKNPSPEKPLKSVTVQGDLKAEMAIILVAITGHSGD